ncbi:MAG: FG-GAP-like repeat-containing protein [Alphaproteobacteria bacterium]
MSDFLVNTTTAHEQEQPSLAALPDGRYVVTWQSEESGGADIRGRMYNADGTAAGDDFVINTTAMVRLIGDKPTVAGLSDGRFVVTWSSDDHTTHDIDIRARVYDANGTAAGNDFIVNTTGNSDSVFPGIAPLPNGRFVVTWQYGVDEIRARLYNADGSAAGNDFVINIPNGDFQDNPTIAGLPDGRFVVTWGYTEGAFESEVFFIHGRMFNADGTPATAEFAVNTTGNREFLPNVAVLPDGRFMVAWASGVNESTNDLRARIFHADGAPAGNDFIITTQTIQNRPAITARPDGHFVVTWSSSDGAADASPDIHVRVYNGDGTAAGNDFIVNTTTLRSQDESDIATLPDGHHYVVTWRSDEGPSTAHDVRAIVLSLNAPVAPATNSVTTAEDTASARVPIGASDLDGDTLSYAVKAGFAAAKGAVSFSNGGFVYAPAANENGSDGFTIVVSDGYGGATEQAVSVTIMPVNHAPVIASNGGGDSATLSILENTTAVTTVAATDVDSPLLTYSIVGGSDAGKFQINASNGVLSFITAPDFQAPTDADHNNSYLVQVRASDGSLSDDQLITVSVTDALPKAHWAASVDVSPHPAGWLPAGIGDFNADGTSDLAWYNSSTNGIDIWKLSNGQWAGSADTGLHPAGYQPVGFGDYNHDGTSDVLWFNSTTLHVDLWTIANGQWAGSPGIGPHPAGWTPLGAGDFNGDGTSDVAWFNPTTHAVDIWKIANGQWTESVDAGTHPAGYQPALTGDFNGDGTTDIAWYKASTGDVDIWKMQNGQWAGSVDVGPHSAGWQPLGAGDFNGDGTSDIAWYNPASNAIDIWLINNGQWAASVDVGTHPAGAVAIGIGDFDHNGVSDIMWRDTATGHIDNWMLAFS